MGKFPLNSTNQYVKNKDACSSADTAAPALIVAAGGLDALEVTGVTLDRKSGTALSMSCSLVTAYLAALDTGETLAFAIDLQESANGTDWDAAEEVQASTVAATAAAAGNERGVVENAIDLGPRKRYIRFNVTPDMSRGGTDEASFHTIAVFGGWTQIPQ